MLLYVGIFPHYNSPPSEIAEIFLYFLLSSVCLRYVQASQMIYEKSRAGGHLCGKQLFPWLSLVVSLMASLMASLCAVLLPTRCLG